MNKTNEKRKDQFCQDCRYFFPKPELDEELGEGTGACACPMPPYPTAVSIVYGLVRPDDGQFCLCYEEKKP